MGSERGDATRHGLSERPDVVLHHGLGGKNASLGRHLFVHRDGRLEAVSPPQEFYTRGGVPHYHCEIIEQLAPLIPHSDIYVSWYNNSIRLASDANGILLVLGDEQGLMPRLSATSLLVAKTGPRSLVEDFGIDSSLWEAVLEGLRLLRTLARNVPRIARGEVRAANYRDAIRVPLGPSADVSNIAEDTRSLAARRIDICYLGSAGRFVATPLGCIGLSPKAVARLRCLRSLMALKQARRDLEVLITCPGICPAAPLLDFHVYMETLADCRICISPRGNFQETFRLYEAARQGCVILSDAPPGEWFFADAPFVVIKDWSACAAVASELLLDPQHLQQLSDRTRSWWLQVASPSAVARKIAEEMGARRINSPAAGRDDRAACATGD